MTRRYFVTNPVCSMMIKNVSLTATVEANGAIIVPAQNNK
jgi:multisubunit Na+/H+ antiporter MnhG subunit